MKTANIATAKNQLSRLIKQVKRGETVLITERNKPVAQIGPVQSTSDVVARLVADGVVVPPQGPPLNVKKLCSLPLPRLPQSQALSQAVLEEREEGR